MAAATKSHTLPVHSTPLAATSSQASAISGKATSRPKTPSKMAMAEGMATKTIARHLGVAIKTVENHKIRIFDKLGVRTQAHAVSVAIGHGLLTTAPRRDPAAPAAGGFPPVVVGPVPAGVSPIAPATPSTMPRRPNSTEE